MLHSSSRFFSPTGSIEALSELARQDRRELFNINDRAALRTFKHGAAARFTFTRSVSTFAKFFFLTAMDDPLHPRLLLETASASIEINSTAAAALLQLPRLVPRLPARGAVVHLRFAQVVRKEAALLALRGVLWGGLASCRGASECTSPLATRPSRMTQCS